MRTEQVGAGGYDPDQTSDVYHCIGVDGRHYVRATATIPGRISGVRTALCFQPRTTPYYFDAEMLRQTAQRHGVSW